MTQFFKRSALLLLATTALAGGANPASAQGLRLRHAMLTGDAAPAELILTASHRRARKPAAPPSTYVVKRGDTLEKISKTLGVTIDDLKDANRLKGSAIKPGDKLKNPAVAAAEKPTAGKRKGSAKAAAADEPAESQTYTVRHGDTLFSISKSQHVSMESLRELNGLSRKASIHSGQVLKLAADEPAARPSRGAGASARAERSVETPDNGRGANGRLVNVSAPGRSYKVRKGDTLEKVARRLDTDVAQLRRDNRLKGSTLRPGRVLRGPGTTAKAYVAASGDTLATVAERFGVSIAALRSENGLSRRAGVRPGQKLRLPAGYRDRGAARTSPQREPVREPMREPAPRIEAPPFTTAYPPRPRDPDAPIATQPDAAAGLPSRPQPYSGTPTTPRPQPQPRGTAGAPGAPPAVAPISAPPPSDAQISQLGRGKFQWPARGQLLSDFGPKPGGQKNDGINIQSAAGEAVHVAADGDVVYAGDQVPGFGNLVLVKHADGWVTAYGHLSRIEVKMQQKVTQGQQIGQVGSTGGVTEPQLHFEVRYAPNPLERARPIDPKLVLPR